MIELPKFSFLSSQEIIIVCSVREQYLNSLKKLENDFLSISKFNQFQNKDIEYHAVTFYKERNNLKRHFIKNSPLIMQELIIERNRLKYNSSIGPSLDYLLDKNNNSWELILESSFRCGGKDLGFTNEILYFKSYNNNIFNNISIAKLLPKKFNLHPGLDRLRSTGKLLEYKYKPSWEMYVKFTTILNCDRFSTFNIESALSYSSKPLRNNTRSIHSVTSQLKHQLYNLLTLEDIKVEKSFVVASKFTILHFEPDYLADSTQVEANMIPNE